MLNYHWYGGPTNPLKADQDMMQELANNMTTLATAHNITDVWISEMKVTNPATEVSTYCVSICASSEDVYDWA